MQIITRRFFKNIEAKVKPIAIMILLLVSVISSISLLQPNTVKGASTDFDAYVEISTDASQIPGALSNYPLLVINYSWVTGLDSDSFSFYDSTGTTELNWELEAYDTSSGLLCAWVDMDTLSATGDTIRLYYDLTASNDGGENNPTSVWDSNYVAVYHFDDASGGLTDSKGSHDMTESGSPTYRETNGSSMIGYGIDFTGTTTLDGFYEDADWGLTSSDISVLAIIDADGYNNSDATGFNAIVYMGYDRFNLNFKKADAVERLQLTWESGSWEECNFETSPSTARKYLFCKYDNNGNAVTYLNNTEANTDANTGTLNGYAPTRKNSIGYADNSEDHEFNGVIDEIRVSSVLRSDNWRTTVYNNINNRTSFITWGSAVTTAVTLNLTDSKFTFQGELGDTVYANSSGSVYETGVFVINGSTTAIERITVNVTDIDANITASNISMKFSSDNSSWGSSTAWYNCSDGAQSIIINGTNWSSKWYLIGTNPFTADGDGDGYNEISTLDYIYWRIKIDIPSGIGEETYSKLDYTWDAGVYST